MHGRRGVYAIGLPKPIHPGANRAEKPTGEFSGSFPFLSLIRYLTSLSVSKASVFVSTGVFYVFLNVRLHS